MGYGRRLTHLLQNLWGTEYEDGRKREEGGITETFVERDWERNMEVEVYRKSRQHEVLPFLGAGMVGWWAVGPLSGPRLGTLVRPPVLISGPPRLLGLWIAAYGCRPCVEILSGEY